MLNELAVLLHRLLATDQNYHAVQQKDGSYKKKNGAVTKTLLERNLKNSGSFAIYQKNNDFTLSWICFDFDVSKANLNSDRRQIAQKELEDKVTQFCNALAKLNLPFLLEFSGNRGFHIWITFSEKINYRLGYDIQQALLNTIQLQYDKSLISIDLFPKGPAPTDGLGLGVKVPLSKHTKSEAYATLLSSVRQIENFIPIKILTTAVIESQITILKEHKSTTKHDIEKILDTFFNSNSNDDLSCARVKSITIQNNSIDLTKILDHWNSEAPLSYLRKKIIDKENLSHEERKLLVGMLHNIKAKNIENAGQKLLIEIFSSMANYDKQRTIRSIENLSSFNFPSQEQIENTTKTKFSNTLSKESLIKACIPTYKSYEDATFEISNQDIEITRIAEINYIFLNDEVQSQLTLNELACNDIYKFSNHITETIKKPRQISYFRHERNEGKKTRTLISMKTAGRLTTSAILKQLTYFFNFQSSNNSHGYKISKGFNGGHIFQPWLYLWIKFISNISTAIEDAENKDYYIIKTDVKSFYDRIPHDNLKRMLLGGVNPRITARLSEHTNESINTYKSYIDTLFDITETIVGSKVGLPQGPAYARYLAELYLDNIDLTFDAKLHQEEIFLYQRYVDDIFIIAPTQEKASVALETLKYELKLLGLDINSEKTSITKIQHFARDFEIYRSQSKYAVDKVSKNFSDATSTEQNLAVNEFIKLVQSDSCNDDLAFIFSHLTGVPQLDSFKRDKVVPTLKKRVGRGSLYKHLFNFVLESSENWESLDSIDEFDELQSEVLTACFITQLELNKSNADELKKLVKCHASKIVRTDLTNEHLAYLVLVLGVDLNIKDIPTSAIISCITNIPDIEELIIPVNLVSQLNTTLNDIKELPSFIEVIYPLCANKNINKQDLNSLAATFFAKLSSDMREGVLLANTPPNIYTPSIAQKYYYLLCLYSISNRNKSPELLEHSWKHCARIFNAYENDACYTRDDWFTKISEIEHSEEYTQLIVSSIIDGSIFRGLDDKKEIFKKFHNLLLFFITFQDNTIKTTDIEGKISQLKDKGTYYKWLIDREHSRLFPPSKKWFESNIIENNSILLRNGDEILFRKPTSSFSLESNPVNEHNGYSEVLANYKGEKLKSFTDIIKEKSALKKLKALVDITKDFEEQELYPNIFCSAHILNEDTLTPFNKELNNLRSLIIERQDGSVEKIKNNKTNFIRAFFDISSECDVKFQLINDKYIKNITESVDLLLFIKNLLSQFEEINDSDESFYYDIAASAALYLSLNDTDPIRKIDSFVHQYHRFNQSVKERHIYAVDKSCSPSDQDLVSLFETLVYSLKKIPTDVAPALALYIYKDVLEYKGKIESIIERSETEFSTMNLGQFRRIRPLISPIQETIHFNGKDYKFGDIQLINITTGEIHKLETRHSVTVNASEHVYFHEDSTSNYIIALHSPLSMMYKAILDRKRDISDEATSYPRTLFSENSILSLDNFSQAVDVISTHQNIPPVEARATLLKWLSSLPKKFYQPLTTLISAHRVMREADMHAFNQKVKSLLEDKYSNPFLIKDVSDYNGTHRLLFKDSEVGRSIESFSPIHICADAKKATVIVDNIITGKQIIKALNFYLSEENESNKEKYFSLDDKAKKKLIEIFGKLETLEICTVFYTEFGRLNIERNLSIISGNNISVKVINGLDINDDALFGTSTKIGENEKTSIRKLLSDKDSMRELCAHLDCKNPVSYSIEDINKTDLVARYQSMPKKCFSFLLAGLKHDPTCHPLTRILELYEK